LITEVKKALETKLFGQHLAVNTIVKSINSHFKTKNQQKALVISFQGWTGTGKTFAAQTIVKNLYKLQEKSKYFHWFKATELFTEEDKVKDYQVCMFLLYNNYDRQNILYSVSI